MSASVIGGISALKWTWSRENLSSGFPPKRVPKHTPQLQRLARQLKFICSKSAYGTFIQANNKGADQTARMRRLVCVCVVCNSPKTGFLATRPKYKLKDKRISEC